MVTLLVSVCIAPELLSTSPPCAAAFPVSPEGSQPSPVPCHRLCLQLGSAVAGLVLLVFWLSLPLLWVRRGLGAVARWVRGGDQNRDRKKGAGCGVGKCS